MELQYNPEIERLDEINEKLSLIQLKTGLTFGTDSYLLAAFSRSFRNETCVELGGGTGVVSLLCASRDKYKKIFSVELQPYFAALISRNAALNSLDDRVISVRSDIRDFTVSDTGGEVISVISNPPYMKKDSGKDNKTDEMNTARREENGTIADFCKSASSLLRFGGYFTAVYRPDRLTELFCSMRENCLEPKRTVLVYPTVHDKPCLVLVEAKKGAKEGVVFSRPLIIYKGKNSAEYTEDMSRIYGEFSLEHLF